MKERWKQIKEYEGHYIVSDKGRIKSLKGTPKLLKPRFISVGYLGVQLCLNGVVKNKLIHRLVAIAFIRNPKSKPCVNHKDGKKINNYYKNLAWNTQSQNVKHAFKNKLKKPKYKAVKQYKNGKMVGKFKSMKEAAKLTGINQGSICSCAGNKLPHAGGFTWKKS